MRRPPLSAVFSPSVSLPFSFTSSTAVKLRVLVDEAGGALFERLGVAVGPPVLEVALGVELPPLIVEAVGQLVADHRAGAAEVHRGVRLRVVERRLQDAGGEVDVVLERVVVRVDRRRRHAPTRSCRPACRSCSGCALELERVRALRVAERVAAHDAQRAVVAPLVGIADLVRRSRAASPSACFLVVVGHPGEAAGCRSRAPSRARAPSSACRSFASAPNASLTNAWPSASPRSPSVYCDAALPARPQLLGPGQRRAVEAEVLVDERRRTARRGGVQRRASAGRSSVVDRRRRQHLRRAP